MNKIIALSSLIILLASGCTLNGSNAGIQIKSSPSSKVFINDKETGTTTYKNEKLKPGEYTIKLESGDKVWSDKVRLTENTILYINRELTTDPQLQSGEIVSLERGKGITVVTTPSQVEVSLDSKVQGNTPRLIPSVSPGIHEISLTKEGYEPKKIKIKAVNGYKIVIEVQLKPENLEPTTPSPTPEASPSAAASVSATASASVSPNISSKPSPSPKQSASASATPKPSSSISATPGTVTILSTPTGWLRVRDKAGIDGVEIAKVNTGDVIAYSLQSDTGWTSVTLADGTKGFVVSKYVKVNK